MSVSSEWLLALEAKEQAGQRKLQSRRGTNAAKVQSCTMVKPKRKWKP